MKFLSKMTWCTLVLAQAALAQRWNIQYFFDQNRETFFIEDLSFPSAKRGIAVGTIAAEQNSKIRYTAIVTSDGGQHWSTEPLKDHPRSLFFLNDSIGWMVADNGIWFTEESGRNWKKIGNQKKPNKKVGPTPPGGLLTRVWFLDEKHGFGVGLQKTVVETHDGGITWIPVDEAAKPSSNPAHTAYSQLAFEGPKLGLIVGGSVPPRLDDPRFPSWMEPERAVKRRQVPTLKLQLETRDGGATWRSSTAPLFGDVAALRLAGLDGMVVFSFGESFEWPSEVYRIDLTTGKTNLAFHAKDRRVFDCALFPGGRAFLAAVEPLGKLNTVPIPGKVKMLTSSNLTDWTEMDVDYKANARSIVLAGPDADNQWAATDTGMILHLVK
ncbi:MAG TPA: hypothetical protein VNX18_14490 [Bryobacteraceae bacterium]|nr:hypothetical protein [Bryobacteraceae bacterium]